MWSRDESISSNVLVLQTGKGEAMTPEEKIKAAQADWANYAKAKAVSDARVKAAKTVWDTSYAAWVAICAARDAAYVNYIAVVDEADKENL